MEANPVNDTDHYKIMGLAFVNETTSKVCMPPPVFLISQFFFQ